MESLIPADSGYLSSDDAPLNFSGDAALDPQEIAKDAQVPADSARPSLNPFASALAEATINHHQRQAENYFPVRTYDPEIKERYKGDPSIYNDNFDPYSDNERVAYENWDKWDAISSGLGAFKDNFANAYSESAYSWVRAGKALFNADTDYLSPSVEELDKMSYGQRRSQIENPIFYGPGEEDDFLTKGFMAEALGNLGFTFGTVSEVISEQLVTKAAEGLLASTGIGVGAAAGLEAAADAQAATKLGRVWKQISALFAAKAAGKSEPLINAAKSADDLSIDYLSQFAGDVGTMARNLNAQNNVVVNGVRYGKGFLDNALSIASKVPFVGEAADAARIARAGKGILNTEEMIKLGAGGLRRSFGEWQMAAGEAAIEAGGNYKEIMDKMTDDYQKTNGKGPSPDELLQMKQVALKSSTVDFGTNVAILGVMNKITFGNMLGKFASDSKKIAAIKDFITGNAAKKGVYTVMGEVGQKPISYQLNTLGVLGIIPKIASDFGKRQAAWELGKSSLKGLTRIEIAEGIQENLQEGTNEALVDYYYSIYKDGVGDWGSSFNEAVESQLTKQGAKTFLMGALTGIFSRPGMVAIEELQKSKFLNPSYAAHRQSVADSLKYMNDFYDPANMKNVMKDAVKMIKIQGDLSQNMLEALSLQDKLWYYNNKDSAIIHAIMHAKRTGTLDTLAQMVSGYGTNFTEAQFKEAFGYTPQELGKTSTSDVMGDIAKSIKNYSDIYDKWSTKFNLILDAGEYLKDKNAKAKFEVRKAALLDAIQTVAFIESKSQAVLDRSADIVSRLSKHKTIGQSLSGSFQTLVNGGKLKQALFLLEQEIKTIRDSVAPGQALDAQTKQLIADKQEELGLLKSIDEIIYPEIGIEELEAIPDFLGLSKTLRGDLVLAMSGYFSLKNKQAGTNVAVSTEDVENSLKDIMDYIALGQDHQSYTDAVNMLNDPDTFGAYHQKMMDARVAAFAKLYYDDLIKLGEISEVAKKWLEDNKDILKKLASFANSPSGTYENLKNLDEIRETITRKIIEFRNPTPATAPAAEAPPSLTPEEIEAIRLKNRELKPADTLYKDPATQAEVDEYMASRYDYAELESTFPFDEEDQSKRVVNRYYYNEKGERTPFGVIRVPKLVDYGDGPVDINNLEALLQYLRVVEESEYNRAQAAKAEASATAAESAEHTENLDEEKVLLENYIDKPVMLNGVAGILRMAGVDYYVEFPDGTKKIIGRDSETTKLSFNDVVELSPAAEQLNPEEKEVLGTTEASRVDVTEEGVVTIELDQSLEFAYINGQKWTLVKDANGMVVEFTAEIEKKKGKSVKRIMLRLGSNNPKTIEYAARINNFLTTLNKPMPETIEDALDEIEVLDAADRIIDSILIAETDQGRRSDILLAQYQIGKILFPENNTRIIELSVRYDKGEALSEDELLELGSWAEKAFDEITKKFSRFVNNPVVNRYLQILQKQYINPINDKLFKADGPTKSRSSKTTKSSPTKKKLDKQKAEAPKRRQRKPSAEPSEPGAQPKERKKKSLVESVEQLQLDFSEKTTKKKKSGIKPVASTDQKIPVSDAKKVIKKMTLKEVKSISFAIDLTQEKPVEDNPFASLTNKKSCEI